MPKKVTQVLTPTKKRVQLFGAIRAGPPVAFLLVTTTLGGYYAAEFRSYPGSVKEELEKATAPQGPDELRWTFGLQRAVARNERSVYMLLWETETEQTDEDLQPKQFVLYLFKLLEAVNIDGKGAFKIATDVDFMKEMCQEYEYQLTDIPMESEKGIIDGTVRERFTLLFEFTIDDDDVHVVLTNAWRFRSNRLDKLGLTLQKASKLKRLVNVEESAEGEKKDQWINVGKVERHRFTQWINDAKQLFGTMPVRYSTHTPSGDDESEIISVIKATKWTAN